MDAAQDEPVVSIEIRGTTVTIDGVRVDHDGTRSPHEVAVVTTATRLAQPLQRPVRAMAVDDQGRTSMVVHPDASVTDVRTLAEAIVTDSRVTDLRPLADARVSDLRGLTDADAGAHPDDPPLRLLSTPGEASGGIDADEVLLAAAPGFPPPPGAPGEDSPAPAAPPPAVPEVQTRASRRAAVENRSFLTRQADVEVAHRGIRGLLTRLGIRTGPSPAEVAQRADVQAVSQHWPGPRTIAVVNAKGGSGKTPAAALLSALFATHGGSGVLAWDNAEIRGTLGWRTEQGPHEAHVFDLLPVADRLLDPTARAADLAAYVHHQTADKYDVLRSNPTMPTRPQRLTAQDFDAVHRVASKYYRLIVVDSGDDETGPHWLRMIDHTDQLVVVTTTRPDHAESARLLLDALRVRDQRSRRLAEEAVVVVSQADRDEASAASIAAGFHGLARSAVTIPYDRALRASWLRFDRLGSATQRAYLRAAAVVSGGL